MSSKKKLIPIQIHLRDQHKKSLLLIKQLKKDNNILTQFKFDFKVYGNKKILSKDEKNILTALEIKEFPAMMNMLTGLYIYDNTDILIYLKNYKKNMKKLKQEEITTNIANDEKKPTTIVKSPQYRVANDAYNIIDNEKYIQSIMDQHKSNENGEVGENSDDEEDKPISENKMKEIIEKQKHDREKLISNISSKKKKNIRQYDDGDTEAVPNKSEKKISINDSINKKFTYKKENPEDVTMQVYGNPNTSFVKNYDAVSVEQMMLDDIIHGGD